MKGQIIKIALAVVVIFILYHLYTMGKSQKKAESFEDYDPEGMHQMQATLVPENSGSPGTRAPESQGPMSSSVDLLPKPQDSPSEFGEFAPTNLGAQNFVDATKLIGVDTVGSSLKNANYSIRRDPPIKMTNAWGATNLSTIEGDLYRRPLDC